MSQQTQANSEVFEFDYTLNAGKVTQTDLTDPEGHIERTTFNADGYALTHVEALGCACHKVNLSTNPWVQTVI